MKFREKLLIFLTVLFVTVPTTAGVLIYLLFQEDMVQSRITDLRRELELIHQLVRHNTENGKLQTARILQYASHSINDRIVITNETTEVTYSDPQNGSLKKTNLFNLSLGGEQALDRSYIQSLSAGAGMNILLYRAVNGVGLVPVMDARYPEIDIENTPEIQEKRDRDTFLSLKKGQLQYLIQSEGDDYTLIAYQPIFSASGFFAGALAVRYDLKGIIERDLPILERVDYPIFRAIINRDGSYLVAFPGAKNMPLSRETAEKILTSEETHITFERLDEDPSRNGNRMLFFRYIPEMKRYATVEISEDVFYGEVYKIRNYMILYGPISVIMTLLLVFVGISWLLGPVMHFRAATQKVNSGDLTVKIPVVSNDEIGEVARYFNNLISDFRSGVKQIRNTALVLTRSIGELAVTAKEISATSNQQAVAVKEIVSTMENNDRMSRDISNRVHEVAGVSRETKDLVENGFSHLSNLLSNMNEIKKTNTSHIKGIRNLSEKINAIWDVVNIINGIADQTKIIAFNAELEAKQAGKYGKNFQIVANEIRRLADNTVNSTGEIKARINEIEHSSENLTIASENGTEIINEGWSLAHRLHDVFQEVINSAEISADSAMSIDKTIKQQVAAFEQVLSTLREISESSLHFVDSVKQTSGAAETLNLAAKDLNTFVTRYRLEEETTQAPSKKRGARNEKGESATPKKGKKTAVAGSSGEKHHAKR